MLIKVKAWKNLTVEQRMTLINSAVNKTTRDRRQANHELVSTN